MHCRLKSVVGPVLTEHTVKDSFQQVERECRVGLEG